jgi:hypothetical protein
MADKKLEKALYGPSMVEVILGAILGLLLGLVVACAYLVFKPVTLLKEKPKEVSRSVVYYWPGSESSNKKQFLAGAKIQLVEDELNAWAATLSAPAPKPAAPAKADPAAAAKPAAPAPEGFVIPAKPNFKITDGKLQIGLPTTLNWFGLTAEVTVQARGVIQKDGDRFIFIPETLYLGSCPLHLLPGAARPFAALLAAKTQVPDDIRAAWAKLALVALEGNTLKLAAQ